MVELPALWLPILISAVLAFVASAFIHMVLPHHWSDHGPLPDEAGLMEQLRRHEVGAGNYVFPRAPDRRSMGTPEFREKMSRGPIGFLTVLPPGGGSTGRNMAFWFGYLIAVAVVAAYVTGRTLGPDAEYLQVFRVAGTVSFLAYAGAEPAMSIWYGRKWSATLKNILDGLVYALLTAGAFAGFWPG